MIRKLVVEPEETAVAREGHGKHATTATDTHATIEELLKALFSLQSAQRQYKEASWTNWIC
jgi:hypothetical protein